MPHRPRRLAALVLGASIGAGLAVAGVAAGQDGADQLLPRYQRLVTAVSGAGGLFEQDKPVVRAVLRDVAAARTASPDDARLWAMDLQLSLWLAEDQERIATAFERLEAMRPDDDDLVLAAMEWRISAERLDAAAEDAAWATLADRFPDSEPIQLQRARRLRDELRYGDVIELVESFGVREDLDPELLLLLAEARFAQHDFQTAAEIRALAGPVNAPRLRQRADELDGWLETAADHWAAEQAIRAAEASADDLPRVAIETAKGTLVVELFENEAPNTVANFISLAESGFYAGTTFHRFLPDFMIQGGDANSKPGATGTPGTGNPGYRIPDEHGDDFPNARRHFNDSIAMANTGAPDSGGSQFYFNHKPTPWLDGRHTVFGRVIDGRPLARVLRAGDGILSVTVLRKRDTSYEPTTIPVAGATPPAPTPAPAAAADEIPPAPPVTPGGDDAAGG